MTIFKAGNREVDSPWAWVVAAAAFMLMFLGYGAADGFGVFFQPLATTFAADRFGTRPVCLLGMLGLGVGLIHASSAEALSQVYVGFGVGVSLGIGCVFAPANAGLQRWFTKNRGLASGLATTGVGVSILAVPPLVAVLIDARGWRQTMWGLGATALVAGTISALFMGDPSRDAPVSNEQAQGRGTSFDLGKALKSRGYAMIWPSSMLCCAGIFVPFVHLVAYASDQGLGERTGVFLIMMIGAASLFGRVVLTAASDRLGRRNSLVAMYIAMALGFLLWRFAGGDIVLLTTLAILFGVGYGGYVSMITPILVEYFGVRKIGSLLGCFMSSIAVGGALGPWLAGYAFDLQGNYDLPILGIAVLGFGAA
ncbi:MAG: MFS transporter, partial [Alphaproteobacteria bacterium]|nr:MFS transporter [Alphaproteobacteria bacterium]